MVQWIELKKGSLIKLLDFFLRNPTIRISQCGTQKKVKLAKATIVKCFRKLVGDNILNLEKIGPTNLYTLNRKSTIVKQLKILHTLTALEGLKEVAEKHNVKIYMYGSAARGEDVEKSDIDLLVIGKIKRRDIIREINRFSEKVGKEIKIQTFSPMEWSRMSRKDKAFYERVEKDKIDL